MGLVGGADSFIAPRDEQSQSGIQTLLWVGEGYVCERDDDDETVSVIQPAVQRTRFRPSAVRLFSTENGFLPTNISWRPNVSDNLDSHYMENIRMVPTCWWVGTYLLLL